MTLSTALAELFLLFQAALFPADPRIQTQLYDPGQVVTVRTAPGTATVVELAPEEHAETVVVGNNSGWQVTLGRSGNALVVKQSEGAASTNLVVLTDARRYVFMLQPGDGAGSGAFVIRFQYGQPGASPMLAGKRIADFRLKGDKALFPVDMYDDGQRTIVTWDPKVTLPAIFAIDDRGREAIVNGRMAGGDYVIEGVAARYVFRSGKDKATAVRQTLGKRR